MSNAAWCNTAYFQNSVWESCQQRSRRATCLRHANLTLLLHKLALREDERLISRESLRAKSLYVQRCLCHIDVTCSRLIKRLRYSPLNRCGPSGSLACVECGRSSNRWLGSSRILGCNPSLANFSGGISVPPRLAEAIGPPSKAPGLTSSQGRSQPITLPADRGSFTTSLPWSSCLNTR